MTGFFDSTQFTQTKKRIGTISGCAACKLYKGCNSPKMTVGGKGEKGILIIGNSPGPTDDLKGKHFCGKAGRILQEALDEAGIDMQRDCRLMYAVNCRVINEEYPNNNQIGFCKPRVLKEIKTFKPKVIILAGPAAVKSVIGMSWKNKLNEFKKWLHLQIPDKTHNAWLCPVFDLPYVLQSDKRKVVSLLFKRDIKNAINCLDKTNKQTDDESCVKIITDRKELYHELSSFREFTDDFLSFDYETTGLKPHKKGHEIVCCSLCNNEAEAITFMLPKGGKNRQLLIDILTCKSIKKAAHNMKFEQAWTKEILGVDVQGWYWDSMIAAHILDNRTKITSLKLQTYLNFGVAGYDESISSFLQAVKKGANEINAIHKAPVKKLLLYCGLDSLYQFRLTKLQMKEMKI